MDVEVTGNCVCWLSLSKKSGGQRKGDADDNGESANTNSELEDGGRPDSEGPSSGSDAPCTFFTEDWKLDVQGQVYQIERCDYMEDIVVGVAW